LLSRDRVAGTNYLSTRRRRARRYLARWPKFVITALDAIERSKEQYSFWSGSSTKEGAARNYLRYLASLFKLAGVPGGHAHRFRDAFAVALLLAGVPVECVSVLLGHSSVKITEKQYSPWVRGRQEQLEADGLRAWERDTFRLASTKGRQR
jgi:integrase/recombinase XerD